MSFIIVRTSTASQLHRSLDTVVTTGVDDDDESNLNWVSSLEEISRSISCWSEFVAATSGGGGPLGKGGGGSLPPLLPPLDDEYDE